MTSLRNILLLQCDVKKAVAFYKEGIGLKLTGMTKKWPAFEAGGTVLSLQEAEELFSAGIERYSCFGR